MAENEDLRLYRAGKSLKRLWSSEDQMLEWLCAAGGLAEIGRALGEEPVLVDRQVTTDGGRADLLLELPSRGEVAVIEAQLGNADVDHLGRLLCYCADLEAACGVLLAKRVSSQIGEFIAACNERFGKRIRLVALEISSISETDGWPAGVILHPPPGASACQQSFAPDQVMKMKPKITAAKLHSEVAGFLRGANEDFALAKNLVTESKKLTAELKSLRSMDLLVWPEPSPADLIEALGHIIAGARGIVVLAPEEAPRLDWLLYCLLCLFGDRHVLEAKNYRYKVRTKRSRKGGRLTIEPRIMPESPDMEEHRSFWNKVAQFLPQQEIGVISTARNQLSYRLDKSGYRLLARYDQKRGTYCMIMRMKVAAEARADNLLEQFQEHDERLRAQLAEFRLGWARGDGYRRFELQCLMRKKFPNGYARGSAGQVAQALCAVDEVLRPLAAKIGNNFVW